MATENDTSPEPKRASDQRSATKVARGLRARCRVRVDLALNELGGLAASLGTDVANHPDGYELDLLLSGGQQRVTYAAGTDRAFTIVHRGAQGAIFWDQRSRTFARLTADDMPHTRIVPAAPFKVEMPRERPGGTCVLTTKVPGLGEVRHEIELSSHAEWAPFGAALLRVLHCGPVCHRQSGLPWQELAEAGLIVRELSFVAGKDAPISETILESVELVDVHPADFEPPSGFQALEKVLEREPAEPEAKDDPEQRAVHERVVKDALAGGGAAANRLLKFVEQLTPDCLGSSRLGPVTAILNQDLFTMAQNAVNLVAPLLGRTTIAGGTWTIPWLTNLAALTAANPNAPGSGIFCFLRDPRTVGSPPFPGAGGGSGLLDRMAFKALYDKDATGMTRTERDFSTGMLPATLASWSAGPPASTNLLAAGGVLPATSLIDQRSLVEAYETMELGVLNIPLTAPGTLGPFPFGSATFGATTTPPLFTVSVSGITGAVNFASLGGGALVSSCSIGGSGNVVLTAMLPTLTATGTIITATTGFGDFVLGGGTALVCFFNPALCPAFLTLLALANFVLNNVRVFSATATAVGYTFDISWGFDPTTERVEPTVTLLARTGTVTVGSFGATPNGLGSLLDALITALGNLFDLWGAALAAAVTSALQGLIRSSGLQLPVAGTQNNLKAASGSALSSAGSILELRADIRPVDNSAVQPYLTQVATEDVIETQLKAAHLNMHRDLNPQGPPPPPGPGPVVTVGTFAGLGLSQNALNYYVYAQWLAMVFERTFTDTPTISAFISGAPALFGGRFPSRVHLWPAVPPRVEIAPAEIALTNMPLIVTFDDVRICFEGPPLVGGDGRPLTDGLWEVSCNFSAAATVELAWPWVFSLRIDPTRPAAIGTEPRIWEFVDPNNVSVMSTTPVGVLAKMVNLARDLMIAPLSSAGVTRTAAPLAPAWTRPLSAIQQDIIASPPVPLGFKPQLLYLELMARRKALHVLPALDTLLFELIDGSGAPDLNIWLAAAGAPMPIPTTIGALRCPQGSKLRDWLLPLVGLPAGP